MKKVISIVAVAAVLGTYAQANTDGIIVKEDFESGADKWGISYSSRYDTAMPSVIGSKDVTLHGDGSLEILPSGALPYNANTDSTSFKYQGVYYGDYIKTEKNRRLAVSVNIKTDGANVRMRYIFMSGNEIKNISDEYILTSGKWMNAEYVFTPDFDTNKGKIVLAFYSTTRSGSESSIYLDDFIFRNSFISPDGWKYQSGTLEESDGTAVYTSDDFSEYKELTYTINKANIEQGLNLIAGEISSDMDDTYITLAVDGAGSGKSKYHITKGETVKAALMLDTEGLGDTVTIRLGIAGNGDEKKVRLSGFDILNQDYIINSNQQDNTLKFSGKLKTGNESANYRVNVGEVSSAIKTNEDGIYSADADLSQMTEDYGYAEISIVGAKGYAGLYPETMIYFVKDTYREKILDMVKAAADGKAVEEILTAEVLNNLGIYCEPLFRNAKLSDVCAYVYADKPGTYEELEKSLVKNACISAVNQGIPDVYAAVRDNDTLFGLEENAVYKDLFSGISEESFNTSFSAFNGKPENDEEFVKKTLWVLIKHAASKCAVNSEVMALLNKYSSDLELDMGAYSAAQSAGKGSAAAAGTAAWIAGMTDYSNIQTKFNEICANAGSSGSSGGTGGTGGSGGISGGSSSGGIYPVTVIPPQKTEENNNSYSFSDISDVPWAAEYIYMLLGKGIISPSDDNTFRPNDNITRAEFAKMTAVMLGLEEDKSSDAVFDDVRADDWYFGYVSALYKKGIVNGMTDTVFGAENNISRQDICTILARAMDVGIADGAKFADDELIAEYAYDAVYKLKNKGCINGYEDNTFRPNAGASRAEVAKIMGMLIK